MNGTIRYTIRPYDTIWMLAQVFNTTVDSIVELNPGIDPKNLQVGQVISIRPGYTSAPSEFDNDDPVDDNEPAAEPDDVTRMFMDLTNYFRLLWEQHTTWTSKAITAILNDLPATDAIVQRLLRNPEDFANAMAPFYGEEAADNFAGLLTQHINLAADMVRAAGTGDSTAYRNARQDWYQNADQMASLLASINSNWSEDDWNAMLDEHLRLLEAYITDMVSGNYEDSVNLYDALELQALEMADMMAEGINKEFFD